MVERLISRLVVVSAAAAGIACLGWWFSYDPSASFAARVPGMDGTGTAKEGAETPFEAGVNIEGTFQRFAGVAADLPGAWPRFRGANFDNVSTESVRLADRWPAGGPPVLWSLDLGEGHAGPAVLNGRVYVLDYDEQKKGDALRCFSLADGKEIWRRWYRVRVKRNHGMSRTVPAVTEKYVVTLGPRCQVLCADAVTGDFRWGMDLVRDYGVKEPLWYAGQCPLIDDSLAIIAPGGRDALMIAVDCATGRVVWKTPNPRGWPMSHSSVMPMTLNGRRMYVYCAIGGMVAVSARREDNGAVLWETPEWNRSVVAPSPVALGDGRIFVTAGYGGGSMMFKVSEENGRYAVKSVYERRPGEGLSCEQQTPVWYEGHLFGVLPKDAGALRNQFVCFSPEGKFAWTSDKANRFGLGPFMVADGKFFVLDDTGVLTMLKATAEGYVRLDQAKVLNGRDAWGPMAIAGGRLLLRDSKRMVCLDVRGK